jgi:hypothetical protein
MSRVDLHFHHRNLRVARTRFVAQIGRAVETARRLSTRVRSFCPYVAVGSARLGAAQVGDPRIWTYDLPMHAFQFRLLV